MPKTVSFDPSSRADRENCYHFRDLFYSCLDKNKIYIESSKELGPKNCRWELNDFRSACPYIWVEAAILKRSGRLQEKAHQESIDEYNKRNYGHINIETKGKSPHETKK